MSAMPGKISGCDFCSGSNIPVDGAWEGRPRTDRENLALGVMWVGLFTSDVIKIHVGRWLALCFQPPSQEQIQIIASAIGKPKTKAPAIAKLNSVTKFASGRDLSTDMLSSPTRGKQQPSSGRCGDGAKVARSFQKVQCRVRRNG